MLVLFLFLLQILLELFLGALTSPLPVSDTRNVRYNTIPVVTLFLILINGVVFMLFQGIDFYQGINLLSEDFFDPEGRMRIYRYVETIWTYGYRGVFMEQGLSIGAMVTFTSMFMHADFWHLLYNMIFLWSFGRRVEDACGPWRFLVFYLVAGMVAHIASYLLNPTRPDIPSIGASGAISGVMGAYLVLFPGAMVTCFWGIGIILRVPIVAIMKASGVKSVQEAPIWRWTINLPSWFVLIAFLLQETLPSLQTIQQGQDFAGVNNLAHVAGFLAALVIFFYVRKDVMTRYFAGRRL